jgi:hypothetical protein
MLNLTIAALAVSSSNASPFAVFSSSIQFCCSHSRLSRFSGPFLLTNGRSAGCCLFRTSFSHFTSTALHFRAKPSLIDQTFKNGDHSIFASESAELKLCEFSKVTSEQSRGDAIYSFVLVRFLRG